MNAATPPDAVAVGAGAGDRADVRGGVVAEHASVRVGLGGDVDERRLGLTPDRVVGPGAGFEHGRGPAVVGALQRDDVLAAGVDARQLQRQVARLRTRVDEEHAVELGRQQLHQPLGVVGHRVVQKPRVGVQQPELARGGRRDPRMRMADDGDVVDHVQVRAAVRVVQVLATAADDLHRPRVVQLLRARRPPTRGGRHRRRRPAAAARRRRAPISGDGSGQSASHASRSRGSPSPGWPGAVVSCTCTCGGPPSVRSATYPTTAPAVTAPPARATASIPASRR